MMKFTSMAVMATVLFAEAAEAKRGRKGKSTNMVCKVAEDLTEGAVQGGLSLVQGKMRDETLKGIKVQRGKFTNVDATDRDDETDNMYVSLFSDGACATAVADTTSATLRDREERKSGGVKVYGQRGESFGDDLDLSTMTGYSMGLYDSEDAELACCVLAVKEKREKKGKKDEEEDAV